jgi:hypothetical protein
MSRPYPRRTTALALASALALLLTACGSSGQGNDSDSHANHAPKPAAAPTPDSTPDAGHGTHAPADAAPVRHQALRPGERRVTVRMPADYTPSAPTGVGTDDYRCFLLDPEVASDQMITGFNVLPGNPDVVHHVIMFRVPPEQVKEAESKDASTPGQGWTCFGDSGVGGGVGQQINDAPWLGAWAPGGSEQAFARGFGEPFDAGSRVVMQVHYNLLAGRTPDRSAAELRLAAASPRITPLVTQLFPAPVELPCRPEHSDGKLCDRATALADVKARFGDGPGSTADLLHLLCGGEEVGEVQSCTRPVSERQTIRGVAGHMHLLGKSIRIEVNPGKPDARTLLDIPVWDFDNQGSRAIKPAVVEPGDTVKVTCRHSQQLRDQLPAFEGIPDKYVVWGEGTTDEMCLGILQVTRP